MSKFSERKFQIYLAIGTVIAPFIISAIIDKSKSIPITSTFIGWMKWIWLSIFEHQFKVWHILLAIILLVLILLVIAKVRTNHEDTSTSLWLDYKSDEFSGMKYKWQWTQNNEGRYQVSNIKPICNCGTPVPVSQHFNEREMVKCPRCNRQLWTTKSFHDIEAIIIDNIERDLYKDKI